MRSVIVGSALALVFGAASVAAACPAMQQNVSADQQVVSSEQTPVKIPVQPKSDG